MSSTDVKFLDLELTREKNYWLDRLSGDWPVAAVPLDFRRPDAFVERGASARLSVPPELDERLRRLCGENDSLTFTVLAAALFACLNKYTGLEEIVVGTAIHEKHAAVAALNKVLALRATLRAGETPRQLLEEVRRAAAEAYAHQKYPFDRLLEALEVERPGNRAPLFSTVITYDRVNNPANVSHLRHDLTLAFSRRGGALSGSVEYSPALFKPKTVELFGAHYLLTLAALMERPDEPLADLELLSDEGRREALYGFNDTARPYPKEKPVQRLFEEQAARTPEAVAVAAPGRELTYRELDARANQLARRLRALGVGRGSRVAICLEHSPETLVCILGVLKAGASYLPFDTGHPQARLDFMLEDAGAAVLLTEDAVAGRFRGGRAEVVSLDADRDAISSESSEALDGGADPDDEAYLIYTSGSTGNPKGVRVPHTSLVNYVWWAQSAYVRGDRLDFPLYSSLAFDLTVTSIFTPLVTGNRVHVYGGDRRESVIQRILADGRVGVLKLTPSPLSLIKGSDNSGSSVRRLVIGGEPLETALARAVHESFGRRVEIFNEYGPTEATVGCMIHRFDPEADTRAYVPIGRPAANARIYLLDAALRPVPESVAGELFIGGEVVAAGYHAREELTAEKFVEDPFVEGGRMYRTGDLARRLPGGALDFLGRADEQVKFHGHRVELNELRAALNRHPQIRDSVVVVVRDRNGHDAMVAYYVSRMELEAGELRAFLSRSMIEEVVPNVFVHIRKLPLTLNGKVNRRALPTLEEARQRLPRAYEPPHTAEERLLADIWAQVLCLDRVGIHENFFSLGGDSILSIRIIAKARQVGLGLTPKQLFQHQTVAELAAAAGKVEGTSAEQGPVTGPVPLTPVQRWFFEQAQPDPHHFNQSMLLEARREIEPALLARAVEHLLRHHDALRLSFRREESGWRQFNEDWSEADTHTTIDLSNLPEAERLPALGRAAAELQSSLNLSEGRLVRAALFKLGGGEPDRVLIVIHHLAVDGVSWRVLLEDLEAACEQLSRGEAVNLPPKTASFKQWAERLAEYARSEGLKGELSVWEEAAAGGGRLPVDHPGGENSAASAETVTAALDEEETRALLQEASAAYQTQINDLLLTALVQVLAPWAGSPSLTVDLEGHGRESVFEDLDVSRTVGWFTSIFPVTLRLEAGDDAGETLKSVKETLRRVPGRGLGYGLLRYMGDGGASARLASLPRAEITFNYLGRFDEAPSARPLFAPGRETAGPNRSPRAARTHALDVSASVAGGRLRVFWTYSRNLHERATVERLARAYVGALRDLVAHCLSPGVGGYTPSDFPEAGLSQQELDALLAEVGDSVPQE
ncbi:MAG: amino acid adenylation domain-containing protein [Pyrinomonadaceae bacterium]